MRVDKSHLGAKHQPTRQLCVCQCCLASHGPRVLLLHTYLLGSYKPKIGVRGAIGRVFFFVPFFFFCCCFSRRLFCSSRKRSAPRVPFFTRHLSSPIWSPPLRNRAASKQPQHPPNKPTSNSIGSGLISRLRPTTTQPPSRSGSLTHARRRQSRNAALRRPSRE